MAIFVLLLEEKSMNRINHHSPDSVLNVMSLSINNSDKLLPHQNVERDEVLFVLNGVLEVFFDKGISVLLDSTSEANWTLIPMNTTHQLVLHTESVSVLEVLGGQFREGATIYLDLLS